MKEKYEHEIRELENSEKGLKDKYIDARTRLAESDANNQNLKAVVTQMELQLSHSTKVGHADVVLMELHVFNCKFFEASARKISISLFLQTKLFPPQLSVD